MTLVPRVIELLIANQQEDVKVFVGGIIPDDDVPKLLELGVARVYGPVTPTGFIVKEIRTSILA